MTSAKTLRSFQRYFVFDILTNPVADPGEGPGEPPPPPPTYLKVWIRFCNPDRVTLTKKGNILEKNPLPISLFIHTAKFVPFLKS